MREWALAWHADYLRANPGADWAREPTDNHLGAIYACGLGDASDVDRGARLAIVPGGALLVDRVDRIAVARHVCKPPPGDDEAIALVRRGIAALDALGVSTVEPGAPIRIVRGPAERSRRPLDAQDLIFAMRRAVSGEARDALDFLTESIYQLAQAQYTLTEWALWPLVEHAMGPCPLDASFELWERGARTTPSRFDCRARCADNLRTSSVTRSSCRD